MAIRYEADLASWKTPEPAREFKHSLQLCTSAKNTPRGLAVLASTLGFDSISYLILNDDTTADGLSHHWTTAGTDWSARYAKLRYHAVDPRIVATHGRHVPMLWNAARSATDWRVRRFLDHAGQYSICSGIAIPLHDARVGRVVVAWDSAASAIDAQRQEELERLLGTLTLLTAFLHEAMLAHCQPTYGPGARSALSERERSCLALAARGMTSLDIAGKLGIAERTVNFHFGNILDKLGALNRSEAVARAIAHNLVSLSH
ncbi:MAG: LuxR C-terminal-related transcriptional regulator [Casimicrobiaceae bacterium]